MRKPQADFSAAIASAEKRHVLTQAVGGGAAPSASALGLSRSTLKTHLARFFAKAGTRGQVQLVKLTAQFGNTKRQSRWLGQK